MALRRLDHSDRPARHRANRRRCDRRGRHGPSRPGLDLWDVQCGRLTMTDWNEAQTWLSRLPLWCPGPAERSTVTLKRRSVIERMRLADSAELPNRLTCVRHVVAIGEAKRVHRPPTVRPLSAHRTSIGSIRMDLIVDQQ